MKKINYPGRSIIIVLLLMLSSLAGFWLHHEPPIAAADNYRIGIVYSPDRAGETAQQLYLILRFSVEQYNRDKPGFVPRLSIVRLDYPANPEHCAQLGHQLIQQHKVKLLYMTDNDRCQQTLQQANQQHQQLLLDPFAQPPGEQLKHTLYTAPTFNQTGIPGLFFALESHQNFLLLHNDDTQSNYLRQMTEVLLQAQGARLLHSHILPPEQRAFQPIIQQLQQQQPLTLINNLQGEQLIAFLQAMQSAQLQASPQLTVFSQQLTDDMLQQADAPSAIGHFKSTSYFKNLNLLANQRFISQLQQHFGHIPKLSPTSIGAYQGLQLWIAALNTPLPHQDISQLKQTLALQTLPGIAGETAVDPDSWHLWRHNYILQVDKQSQFGLIRALPHAIHPNGHLSLLQSIGARP